MIRLMLALAVSPSFSQVLQFEVASVRTVEVSPNQPCPMSRDGGPGTARPTCLNYTCFPLAEVIGDAFDVPGYRTSGLDRIGLKMVTILAKPCPDGTTKDQLRTMLQNLLTERFQLKVHRETREGNAFELTVEASGHKLKENENPALARPDARPQPLGKMDGYSMPELPNDMPGTVRVFYSPSKGRARGYAAPLSELTSASNPT
jgi:uncharacterized protein (TIGR03435 family)